VPPGPWNDGVGISIKLLLSAEIRNHRVDPYECVLVAGNGLELIGQQRFVALDDGLSVYIFRDDTTVGSRFLTTIGRFSFLRGRFIHD